MQKSTATYWIIVTFLGTVTLCALMGLYADPIVDYLLSIGIKLP